MGTSEIWDSGQFISELSLVSDIMPIIGAESNMRSLATMFLYMVAELSGVSQVINALTGLDGLPVIIVEVVVTSIYTGKRPPSNGGINTNYRNSSGRLPCIFHYR